MDAPRAVELDPCADARAARVVHALLGRPEPPVDTAQMFLLATPQITLIIGIPRV